MPAFLVEDGTGLELATSYVSEAFADDYLGTAWAVDSAAKQAALMTATEYADARWGPKLKGRPLEEIQALEFPRSYLYNRYGKLIEGVPGDWMRAVCGYAKQSVAGTLYPIPPTGTAQDVKRKKTVVGPITTEVEYQGMATAASFLSFPLPDKLAKQYTTAGQGGVIRS